MTLDQYGHLFPDDLDDVADKIDGLVSGVPKMCPRGPNPGVKTSLELHVLLWSCRESNQAHCRSELGKQSSASLCQT
jgi:hypothetical protein